MNKLLLSLLLVLGLTLISCGEDDGPTITITSPSEGDVFMAGQTITITGSVTDDLGVASVNLSSPAAGFQSTDLDLSTATDRSNIGFTFNLELGSVNPETDVEFIVTATNNSGILETESVTVELQ